jgi:hypothetical protein
MIVESIWAVRRCLLVEGREAILVLGVQKHSMDQVGEAPDSIEILEFDPKPDQP